MTKSLLSKNLEKTISRKSAVYSSCILTTTPTLEMRCGHVHNDYDRLNAEVGEPDAEVAEEDTLPGREIISQLANMAKQVGFHRILK